MANDKKFIVKNGLRADNVEFTDSQAGSNQITLNMLNTDTLNFEGDAGTLFGISDNLTGIVFSVNDVSGIPILEVDGDTHNVSLVEYDGKVMIGGTDSGSTDSDVLNVTGNVRATVFSGSGASLTNIPAAQLTGDVSSDRLSLSASDIPNLATSKITSGTFDSARLPAGVSFGSGGGGGVSSDADGNTAGGSNALDSLTAGQGTDNTAFGINAGTAITTGDQIVAIGHDALKTSTASNRIVAIGSETMSLGTGGFRNICIGYQTGQNLTGNDNVLIGDQVLVNHTSTTGNVMIGSAIAFRQNGGNYNTYIGYTAGTSFGFYSNQKNTAVGAFCMQDLRGGADQNTAIGYEAGYNQQNYDNNVYVGYQAGYSGGGQNGTFVGANSGSSATTGTNNMTCIGTDAGARNGKSDITCVGYQAGKGKFSGSGGRYSTCVGAYSFAEFGDGGAAVGNVGLGYYTGYAVTTGTYNTFLGYQAGDAVTTGSNNIAIGKDAAISSNDVSNEVVLGNSSISALRCQVQTISSLSDERDKSDIKTLPDATDFIKALNPVSFTWNQRDGGREGIEDHGFTAQELLSAQKETGYTIPELVNDKNPDKLEAAYGRLLPTLVSVIKKQQNTIETLEKRISALENL